MEYSNMKVSELREVARSRGLKGWTALRKNDLREFLINNGVRKPSTSRPKRVSKQNLDKKPLEDLLTGDKEPIPTLPPPLVPTPYKPPTPSAPIPKPRTKAAKAVKQSWYDWLLSHVPEPIRSATSRIKRQILSLYDNTEPREFEISSSKSAFRNFTERHTIQGVSGVDATSFLEMVKSTVV